MKKTTNNDIYVGNIGNVARACGHTDATRAFRAFVQLSKDGIGRAAGASVWWLKDGDPYKTYQGPLESNLNDLD